MCREEKGDAQGSYATFSELTNVLEWEPLTTTQTLLSAAYFNLIKKRKAGRQWVCNRGDLNPNTGLASAHC